MEPRTETQTYHLVYMATRAGVMSSGLSSDKILKVLMDVELGGDWRHRKWSRDVSWLFEDPPARGEKATMHEYTKRALLRIYDEMVTAQD